MQPPSSEPPLPEPTPDGDGDIPLRPEPGAPHKPSGEQWRPLRLSKPARLEQEPPLITLTAVGALGASGLLYLINLSAASWGGILVPVYLLTLVVYLAVAIGLLIWGALGTGAWYLRWPASMLVIAMILCPPSLLCDERASGAFLYGTLAVLAAQAPFWLLRFWPGYCYVFAPHGHRVIRRRQFQIVHLLGATLLIALWLSLAQAELSLRSGRQMVESFTVPWEFAVVQLVSDVQQGQPLLRLLQAAGTISALCVLPFFLIYWLHLDFAIGCTLSATLIVGLTLGGCIFAYGSGSHWDLADHACTAIVMGPLTLLSQFGLYHMGYYIMRRRDLDDGPPLTWEEPATDSTPLSPFEPEDG